MRTWRQLICGALICAGLTSAAPGWRAAAWRGRAWMPPAWLALRAGAVGPRPLRRRPEQDPGGAWRLLSRSTQSPAQGGTAVGSGQDRAGQGLVSQGLPAGPVGALARQG